MENTGSGNERPSFYQTGSSERNSACEFLQTHSILVLSASRAVNMLHATERGSTQCDPDQVKKEICDWRVYSNYSGM